MLKQILIGFAVLLFGINNAYAKEFNHRLTDFYAGPGTIRLQGKQAEQDLSIPLSPLAKVTSAELDLKAVSSIALVKKRSVLSIRFNNATIAQIAYDPNKPNVNSRITIPAKLWRSGYNQLTFAVTQQNDVEMCANGRTPELWSEIDLYHSHLHITTEDTVKSLSLEDLSGFFNSGIGGQRSVLLATPNSTSSKIIDQALPSVAQALALRNDYQPLSVDYQSIATKDLPQQANTIQVANYAQSAWYLTKPKLNQIHVLIGNKHDLSPLLSKTRLAQIDGPFLAIEKTPVIQQDNQVIVPSQYRLIVSGKTDEDVVKAAKTLALMDDALNPDTHITIVNTPHLTTPTLLHAHVLIPGKQYSFQEIGDHTTTYRGAGSFNKRVNITLPADFYVPENVKVKLFLDFAYGAALGDGSMMNVLVNGKIVHGLTLSNKNGESFHDYQLNVPARYFKGGVNHLDFAVTMQTPQSDTPCRYIDGRHMVFQIFNSSHIVLPKAGSLAVQPNLKLWAATSYPIAQFNSDTDSKIYVTDPKMLPAALSLSGKLAQVSGVPNLALEIVNGLPKTLSQNAVVLATPKTLNKTLFTTFATSLLATKKWPYRMQNALHNRVTDILPNSHRQKPMVHSDTEQVSTLGDQAVLLAGKNPLNNHAGTLFLLTADSANLVNQRVQDLISLSLWGQVAGDFFTWDNDKAPKLVMQVAHHYQVGDKGDTWLKIRLWLSNNPIYWLAALLFVIVMTSLIAYLLLKKRHQTIEKEW